VLASVNALTAWRSGHGAKIYERSCRSPEKMIPAPADPAGVCLSSRVVRVL
jgi:hypothetical protein